MRQGRLLTVLVLLGGCSSHRSGVNSSPDLLGTGDGGDGSGDLAMSMPPDLLMSTEPPDLYGIDGGSAYGDIAFDRDASGCVPGQSGTVCANPIGPNAGCGPVEDCLLPAGGTGNGLDDDCNGKVDDGCPCTPGDVRRCFLGPPGKRGVGGCTDGTETCIGNTEFGTWGDCIGSIGPGPEVCDTLDNDCNGCADDQLCCNGGVECPGPNDPRIAPVAPFSTKMYSGASFFSGNGVTWTWTVEGGPCDKLFASPGFTPAQNPPAQSFRVTGGNTANPSIYFSLSGDYTVTMTVVDDKGATYTCKWVQHVIGPGVRFELCWDHQGTGAQGGADLDLHVHKAGTTTPWFGTVIDNGRCSRRGACAVGSCDATSGHCLSLAADDCYYLNCTALSYQAPIPGIPAQSWYTNSTPATNCQGNAKYGTVWQALGYCGNPRLDLDNILTVGMPENTNIDDPKNGDSFRALVHYYGRGVTFPCSAGCPAGSTCNNTTMLCVDGMGNALEGSDASTAPLEEHPIVNIYCGGTLKATYGQAPNPLSGFNWGAQFGTGQIWRVADVNAQVDASGNTTGCAVTALHPPASTAGYYVITDPANTNMSY